MNYQEFITEVNKRREEKLNYQYGERNKPENYLPKDPVKDALNKKKVAQGETLKRGNTYLSQLAPVSKSNQLPGKYSKIVITTDTPSDRMKSLEDRVRRYGNLRRLKDIDERNP